MSGYKLKIPVVVDNPDLPILPSVVNSGTLLLVDFSNPESFPLQGNISSPSQVYNLANRSQVATITPPSQGLSFENGGLKKMNTGGSAFFDSTVADLYALGENPNIFISVWIKIPELGFTTNQYQDILARRTGSVTGLTNQITVESGADQGTRPRFNISNGTNQITSNTGQVLQKGVVYNLCYAWYQGKVRIFLNGAVSGNQGSLASTRAAQVNEPLRFLSSGFFHTLYRFSIENLSLSISGEINDISVLSFANNEYTRNFNKFS